MERTIIGKRFQEAYLIEQQATQFEERFAGRGRFYVRGWKLFKEYPIAGVGLGNYQLYANDRLRPHTDYVIILAETGLIGFLFYFGAYSIILLNLIKAFRSAKTEDDKYTCQFFLAAVIVILIIAAGRWNYSHIPTYIFLATAGVAARTVLARANPSFKKYHKDTPAFKLKSISKPHSV